jgi:hypothetical protein
LLLAALRRLVVLVVLSTAGTAAVSVLLGAAIGASISRSISLGLYLVGCFLMVAGFFVGNRGPARVKSETAGSSAIPFPLFGSRRLRWATLQEQGETINQSAIFVTVGLILIVVGIAVDSRHSLI